MTDLKDLLTVYKNAVFQKDIEAFASVFDEKARIFDMWNKWSYDELESWRGMASEWFASLGSENCVVEFKDVTTFESGDFGYLSAFAVYSGVSATGETLRSLQNRFTWVARRHGDSWKVIHEHTSSPVNSDTMEVDLKLNGA